MRREKKYPAEHLGGEKYPAHQVARKKHRHAKRARVIFCCRSIRVAVYSNGLFKVFGCDVQQERNWEFMMCIRCDIGNSKIA